MNELDILGFIALGLMALAVVRHIKGKDDGRWIP